MSDEGIRQPKWMGDPSRAFPKVCRDKMRISGGVPGAFGLPRGGAWTGRQVLGVAK